MTTDKQIAANRLNAKNSTGPRTDAGKCRSRRNAIRHGLTAETTIGVLEDPTTYRALQRAIYRDYRPRTSFELELVAQLVTQNRRTPEPLLRTYAHFGLKRRDDGRR